MTDSVLYLLCMLCTFWIGTNKLLFWYNEDKELSYYQCCVPLLWCYGLFNMKIQDILIWFACLVCAAVFVVFQTFWLGNGSNQVHYQSQECEGWRQQRIRVKELNCQVESCISKKIKFFKSFLWTPSWIS